MKLSYLYRLYVVQCSRTHRQLRKNNVSYRMATANRRWEFMYDIQFEKKRMYDTSRQILCIVCISSCHIIVTRLNAFTC